MVDLLARLKVLLQTITIPYGTGDGTPREYTAPGDQMPADLIAYYATGPWDGNPEDIQVGTLNYGLGTVPNETYIWVLLVTNTIGWGSSPILTVGVRDPLTVDVFKEIYRVVGSTVEFHPDSILKLRGGGLGFFLSQMEAGFSGPVFLSDTTEVESGATLRIVGDGYLSRNGNDEFIVGFLDDNILTSASSNFTTTETVVQTITIDQMVGHDYRIIWSSTCLSSVAGDRITWRIRETNVSGTVIKARDVICSTASNSYDCSLRAAYSAGATGSKTFVVTGQRAAGTGNCQRFANANNPSILDVFSVR